jgi:hypothetical protein
MNGFKNRHVIRQSAKGIKHARAVKMIQDVVGAMTDLEPEVENVQREMKLAQGNNVRWLIGTGSTVPIATALDTLNATPTVHVSTVSTTPSAPTANDARKTFMAMLWTMEHAPSVNAAVMANHVITSRANAHALPKALLAHHVTSVTKTDIRVIQLTTLVTMILKQIFNTVLEW